MHRHFTLPIAALLALTYGCNSNSRGDGNFTAEHTLEWRKVGDGSSFARLTANDGMNEVAVRCWPVTGRGFRCLRAGIMHSALGALTVAVADEPELPNLDIGFVSAGDGYSCGYVLDFTEEISRSGSTLVSNQIDFSRPRWSRSYVTSYMQKNGVAGQPYFKCLAIANAVKSGSLETIGTTTVTKAMID